MKSNALILLAWVLVCIPVSRTLAGAAHDPAIGVWKLDLARSKLQPPVPKSLTRTYALTADGSTKMTIRSEESDGRTESSELTYQLDGKDYPVRNAPGYDAVAATLVDQYTVTFDLKKDGKRVGTFSRSVSTDGKTLTATSQMPDSKGETRSETEVYTRQR